MEEGKVMKLTNEWTSGKCALITGASDGIGREIARNLEGKCKKIILIARRPEKLKALKKELNHSQTEIEICPMDIRDVKEMKRLIEKIYDMDGEQVDLFINCAGGSHVIELFEEMSHSDIEQIFDTNAKAPILWLRELLPRMKNNSIELDDRKRAHILMMSSRSAERALPRLSVYASAKESIEKFIEAMRREYAQYQIVFTLIAPGSINTSFTANWSEKNIDEHNAESITVEEAILPILQALNVQFATNKISYESTTQWLSEPGVLKSEKKQEKEKTIGLQA